MGLQQKAAAAVAASSSAAATPNPARHTGVPPGRGGSLFGCCRTACCTGGPNDPNSEDVSVDPQLLVGQQALFVSAPVKQHPMQGSTATSYDSDEIDEEGLCTEESGSRLRSKER